MVFHKGIQINPKQPKPPPPTDPGVLPFKSSPSWEHHTGLKWEEKLRQTKGSLPLDSPTSPSTSKLSLVVFYHPEPKQGSPPSLPSLPGNVADSQRMINVSFCCSSPGLRLETAPDFNNASLLSWQTRSPSRPEAASSFLIDHFLPALFNAL